MADKIPKSRQVSLTNKLLMHLDNEKTHPFESYDMVIRRIAGLALEPGQQRRLHNRATREWVKEHNSQVFAAASREDEIDHDPIEEDQPPI